MNNTEVFLNIFEFKSVIDKVMKDLKKEDAKLRLQAAKMIKEKIKEKINKHEKSNPGEPPGVFSGNLLKGIKTKNEEYSAIVGAVAPAYHAKLLEFGTKTMKPRPFLLPTMEENKPEMMEILSGSRA
jgi:HK97 gp10 family phage protein